MAYLSAAIPTIGAQMAQSPKLVANLRHDSFGRPVYIGCREAEQPIAGANEAILAAVVIHKPVTVVVAVIFNCQALIAVEQIWSGQETALPVEYGNLNLRTGEPGEHEEHPQPCLHW
jgi:S-methylmethionine-dependent homocysteine/selenocysteine methylase